MAAKARSERVAAAQREVELSRRRLADTHEQVVKPLRDYAERNNFAQLIADSLVQGRRKGAGG
jgi:hypothetical protein